MILYLLFTIALECLGLLAVIGSYRILILVYGIWNLVSLIVFAAYFRVQNPSLIINIGLYLIDLVLLVRHFHALTIANCDLCESAAADCYNNSKVVTTCQNV